MGQNKWICPHSPRSSVSPGTERPGRRVLSVTSGQGRPNDSSSTRDFQIEPGSFLRKTKRLRNIRPFIWRDKGRPDDLRRRIGPQKRIVRHDDGQWRSACAVRVRNVNYDLNAEKTGRRAIQPKRYELITIVGGDDGCCFAITTVDACWKISKKRATDVRTL